MPADVGLQSVTILYNAQALSSTVNRRHQGVRKTGVYSGGYLSIVDTSNCQLSTLVCEISDGTYQVKIATGSTVNIAVAEATPYIVLRWLYTGSAANDFMSITAVASPATNDVVVGLCSFTGGGDLQGFVYTARTTPDIFDLFLKVEETEDTELRVRIRKGRVISPSAVFQIDDQLSDLFVAPSVNPKVYLVYVNQITGAISIDSTGTEAASPTAPSYLGKLVIAEVQLAVASTNITTSMITDTRNFLSSPSIPDDSSLELDATGKLSVKDAGITEAMLSSALASVLGKVFQGVVATDSLGNALAVTSIYEAQVDGFIIVPKAGGPDTKILTGNPTADTIIANHTWSDSTTYSGLCVPIQSGYKVQITGNVSGSIYWQAMGTGDLVKQ